MTYSDSPTELLFHVLHASPYAIIVIEKSGMIVEWNPQAEALFGWPREEALGQPIHELVIPERLRTNHISGIESFLRTGESQVLGKRLQVAGLRRNGDEFPAELSITMETEGKYFAAFVRDLTDVKQTEKLLLENQQRLAHVSRLNTLSELASGIAHEINQPLTAIANTAATSLLSNDIKVTQEHLNKIEKYVALAGQLVNRFRSLASKSFEEKELVDINTPINEALELMDNHVRHQSIEVNTQLFSDLPKIPVDKIQIQQVIVNLLQNAIDALSEQPIKSISIISSLNDDCINVAINNNGPKLTDNKIFDSFYTTKSKGMGLGLSISRTIIENHGGRIWLNENAKETEFCFTIPVEHRNQDNG